MTNSYLTPKSIDFDFVELRGVSPVLLGFGSSFTPAPGGAKNRNPQFIGTNSVKPKLIYFRQSTDWGKLVDI
jgi:hypothetical protein